MGEALELLTRQEAAELLRVNVKTVDRLRAAGRMRVVKLGKRVLIDRAELERLVKEGSDATAV